MTKQLYFSIRTLLVNDKPVLKTPSMASLLPPLSPTHHSLLITHLLRSFLRFAAQQLTPLGMLAKSLFYLLIPMSLLISCQSGPTRAAATSVNLSVPKTELNVSYGEDTAQRMDIYLPPNRSATSTKAIILIHGGGWNSGDKADFRTYIDTFKRRLPGYAIFNINYRLVSEANLFPAQELDVKAAVDFIAGNADEYGIHKEKLVLLGASAGAHLALLQAYKYSNPDVKAVIDFFGPTDLVAMYNDPWHNMIPFLLQMLTGTTPKVKPDVYQQSSPAFFVNNNSAPTLILQGGRDQIVAPSQSHLLQQKLEQAGVPHDLVLYPKERHGWYGANLVNSFDRIEAFLKEHVQ